MLVIFVLVELGFSYFNFATPLGMFVVAAIAMLFRLLELLSSKTGKELGLTSTRNRAVLSIVWGLALPFALAAATRQFHTHYFGLLVLPVLETALYFSLYATLAVAAIGSCSGIFWVAYAAHFTPPFQLGELLETATLVLMLFVVGTLVWLLLHLLAERELQLKERLADLEATRSKLIEGEKLAAIGRLASAMAHEIRNPVAIISSAIEAASSQAFTPAEREEMSKVAATEARRLEKLTTDFLTYAQPGPLMSGEVDATALVGSMSSIARAHTLGKQVEIHLVSQDCCFLQGNEDQLQQAMLNLLRNAIEACPQPGHVSIGLESLGGWVRISFENDGEAIPEDIVPKIFEPFFTAKRGGTGLGLSIVRKIAENHEGKLILDRNERKCVRFSLLLPVEAGQNGGHPWRAS